jgi:hypothetical protein
VKGVAKVLLAFGGKIGDIPRNVRKFLGVYELPCISLNLANIISFATVGK